MSDDQAARAAAHPPEPPPPPAPAPTVHASPIGDARPIGTVSIGTVAAARLVAGREVRARLRSRVFVVSTIVLLVAVVGTILVGSLATALGPEPRIAVVGSPTTADGRPVADLDGYRVTEADDLAEARRLVVRGTVEAAVIQDASAPLGYRVWAKDDVPTSLVQRLSVAPEVTLLAPNGTDGLLRYLVALGFGLVFLISATTFGSAIAQSVVEEKSTRIVELLLATIPPRAMLAGKVIGNSLLAFGQIVLLLAVALGTLALTGQAGLLAAVGAPVLWFVLFFVLGFVLLASMFAAAAALVSRQEDLASTTTPISMVVMLPYVLVLVFNDNPVALAVMSYVPFSAPVAMPLRLYLGQAQWWEIPISLIVLVGGAAAVLALGARIYERSLLKLGARVSWREALRG